MPESAEVPIQTEKKIGEPLLGEVLMTRGDETGDYWRQHCVYPTPEEVQDVDYLLKTEKSNQDTTMSFLGEKRMAYLSSPEVCMKIGKAIGIEVNSAPDIYPIKAGSFEVVCIADFGKKQAILTIPNIRPRVYIGRPGELFVANQREMRKSWNTIPGVCPQVYVTSEEVGAELSVMELVKDHEELNFNALFTDNEQSPDERIPIPQFLTRNALIHLANGNIRAFPQETKELFNAYAIAKLVALRSLMALSTLEQINGGVSHMTVPRSLRFSAGDPVGKINNERQLNMRAIAFNLGRSAEHIEDLVQSILDQHDGVYKAEDFLGHSEKDREAVDILQIPQFPEREMWVRSIVLWMVQGVLDAKKR